MRRTFPFVLLVTALLACRPDAITSDDRAPYAGDYTLRSVNGFPLPYAVKQSSAETLEITDETFTLTATGSFIDITHYRDTISPTVTFPVDTLTGTFTLRGETLTFTTSKNDVFLGTMGTTQFTINGSSTILLYQK